MRVGSLAIVIVTQPSADTERVARQTGFTEEPTREIHLMNALVAQIAVAVIPDPMPFIMHRAVSRRVAIRRYQGRRTGPQIVIDAGWNRLWTGCLANAVASLVTEPARRNDFAKLTRTHPRNGFCHAFAGTYLNTRLDHAFVFFGRGRQLPAFPDIVRDRLLNIDVFA